MLQLSQICQPTNAFPRHYEPPTHCRQQKASLWLDGYWGEFLTWNVKHWISSDLYVDIFFHISEGNIEHSIKVQWKQCWGKHTSFTPFVTALAYIPLWSAIIKLMTFLCIQTSVLARALLLTLCQRLLWSLWRQRTFSGSVSWICRRLKTISAMLRLFRNPLWVSGRTCGVIRWELCELYSFQQKWNSSVIATLFPASLLEYGHNISILPVLRHGGTKLKERLYNLIVDTWEHGNMCTCCQSEVDSGDCREQAGPEILQHLTADRNVVQTY